MKYLFLDDIKEIVDLVQTQVPECDCYHIDITRETQVLETLHRILESIVANETLTIITDYGINDGETGYTNIFDLFLDDLLVHNSKDKIYRILVYSYQSDISGATRFNIDVERRKDLFGRNRTGDYKLISKLTSATFVRTECLYFEDGNINKAELGPYALYLSDLISIVMRSETLQSNWGRSTK